MALKFQEIVQSTGKHIDQHLIRVTECLKYFLTIALKIRKIINIDLIQT